MAIFNEEYIRNYNQKIKSLNEVSEILLMLGITAGAIITKAIAIKIKQYRENKLNKNKSEKEKKIIKKHKDYTNEEKQEYQYLFDTFCKNLASYLKKYAIDNKFTQKYKKSLAFDLNDIKPDDMGLGVQITEFQDGIAYDEIEKWQKDNPNKDWTKAPEFDNEWYHKLLKEGLKSTNKIFKDIQKSSNDWSITTSKGDGDEGIIYVEIDKYNKGD